jgi:cation diffusion facilitator family transporter
MNYVEKISRRFAKGMEIDDSRVRPKLGQLEGWISIVVNLILFISKLLVGLWINSIALIADAFHSFSDVWTSVIVILGYRLATKPGDQKHPYGHERIEYIAALIIAILLAIVGFEFVRQAFNRFRNPVPVTSTPIVWIFVVATIVIKWWIGDFSSKLGKIIKSDTLKADAFHHYSDAFSSAFVLLAVVGSALNYPALDGIGGILVGLILIYGAYAVGKNPIDMLIGKPPEPELIQKIQKLVTGITGVMNSHDLVVHSYGEQKFISIHIEVDQKKSITRAHEISDAVEELLDRELRAHSVVHVDPVDLENPALQRLHRIIQDFITGSSEIKAYHDLRIIQTKDRRRILFDIVAAKPNIRHPAGFQDYRVLKDLIRHDFQNYEIDIQIDQLYTYS